MAEQAKRELPGWMVDHMRRYLATNGADGHVRNGVPTLLLTTKGRRSGDALMLQLIYGTDKGRYLIVASKGGNPTHPAWYLNLVAEPRVDVQVDVQVGAEKFNARARTATPTERPALWATMEKVWPAYVGAAALGQLWMFWIAPLVGAGIAGFVYRWFEEKT